MTKEYMFLVYRWVKSFQNSGSIFSQKIHYLEKLPYWFDYHLLSMDSDLSAYLKNISFKNEVNIMREVN